MYRVLVGLTAIFDALCSGLLDAHRHAANVAAAADVKAGKVRRKAAFKRLNDRTVAATFLAEQARLAAESLVEERKAFQAELDAIAAKHPANYYKA